MSELLSVLLLIIGVLCAVGSLVLALVLRLFHLDAHRVEKLRDLSGGRR